MKLMMYTQTGSKILLNTNIVVDIYGQSYMYMSLSFDLLKSEWHDYVTCLERYSIPCVFHWARMTLCDKEGRGLMWSWKKENQEGSEDFSRSLNNKHG